MDAANSIQRSMLNLTALRKVLSAVLSPPHLHTAILFTPSGDLLAHATDADARSKDQLRILVGLAGEVWLEASAEGVGMAESELGKILVFPLYHSPPPRASRSGRSSSPSSNSVSSAQTSEDPLLLIVLNASDDAEWAEMQIKAQGVANHLAGPLTEFKDHLLPSPPKVRAPERFY